MKLWWISSNQCAAVAAESNLDPVESTGKGVQLEHQQHIQVYSPNQKSSREMMVSTRGKIGSDKSVLNSV